MQFKTKDFQKFSIPSEIYALVRIADVRRLMDFADCAFYANFNSSQNPRNLLIRPIRDSDNAEFYCFGRGCNELITICNLVINYE